MASIDNGVYLNDNIYCLQTKRPGGLPGNQLLGYLQAHPDTFCGDGHSTTLLEHHLDVIDEAALSFSFVNEPNLRKPAQERG